MVVEVSTGNGFRSTISYVHKEHEKDLPQDKKPEVIEKNLVFGNTPEMARQMRFVSNANSRISKPVMHISVSFDAKEKLSEDQRQTAVQSVLKEMGVKSEDHQFLIVKHNDTANPHYHIVLNKVDLDGKKLNLGFDGKKEEFIKNRLQVIADKIEQEQGLKRTEGRNIVYDANSVKGYRFLSKEEKAEQKARNKKEIREKNPNKREQQNIIKNEISNVLQDKKITSPDQFKQALASKGVEVRFSENRNGISGIAFSTDKISVKGSQVGAKWSDISKVLNENKLSIPQEEKLTREEALRYLKSDLYNAISASSSLSGPNIKFILEKKGFEETREGYMYHLKGNDLLIKSDLEKVVSNSLRETRSIFDEYNKQKEREEKILKMNPKEIKPVPFLFGSKVKEENTQAESFNKRLAEAKENIKQNPAKVPIMEERAILKKHVDQAFSGDILLLKAKPQEKELSRFEQMKAQREEKEKQEQERPRSYRR